MKRKVKTAMGVAMLLMFSTGVVANASQNVGRSWIGRDAGRETASQLMLLNTATHGVNGLAARIENRDTTQNSGWTRKQRTANYPSGETVLGEENYVTEFEFFLEGGYQVEIPFVIDVNFSEAHYTYKLTAGVFVDPIRDVMTDDNHWEKFSWSQGMVLNSDLILGSGSDIYFDFPKQTEPIERQEDTWFVDLKIAQEFILNEYGFLSPPDFVQQVRRGEDIEFSFYASPFTSDGYELENYIIIGMLDWRQIPLNGLPYLFIDAQDSGFEPLLDYGVFTLEAIEEVGLYDFVALLIPNPMIPNSLENSYPLMMSNRFVIEVVE